MSAALSDLVSHVERAIEAVPPPLDLDAIEARAATAMPSLWVGCSCGVIPHREECPRRLFNTAADVCDTDIPNLCREVRRLRAIQPVDHLCESAHMETRQVLGALPGEDTVTAARRLRGIPRPADLPDDPEALRAIVRGLDVEIAGAVGERDEARGELARLRGAAAAVVLSVERYNRDELHIEGAAETLRARLPGSLEALVAAAPEAAR